MSPTFSAKPEESHSEDRKWTQSPSRWLFCCAVTLPGWMSGVLSNNSCPSHHPSKLWGSSQHGMGDSHNQHLVRFMQILIECLAPSPLHKHLEITKESVSRIFGGQSFCWGLGWEDGFKYSSKTISKVFSIFLGRFSELHDISTPCPSP